MWAGLPRVRAEMSSLREQSLQGPQCLSESIRRSWTAASSLFIKLVQAVDRAQPVSRLLMSCFIIQVFLLFLVAFLTTSSDYYGSLVGSFITSFGHYLCNARFPLKAVYTNCAVWLQLFCLQTASFWFLTDPLHSSVLSPKLQVQTQREAEGELWNSWIPRPWSCELRFCLLPHWHVECGRHHLHAVGRPFSPLVICSQFPCIFHLLLWIKP